MAFLLFVFLKDAVLPVSVAWEQNKYAELREKFSVFIFSMVTMG